MVKIELSVTSERPMNAASGSMCWLMRLLNTINILRGRKNFA